MSDATIERLQQRYDQMSRQDDLGFVRRLATYLEALDSDRRARNIVRALRADADEALERYSEAEAGYVRELSHLRRRFARDAPEVDDSNVASPDQASRDYAFWKVDSFASFDRSAEVAPELGFAPLPYYGSGEPGRVRLLCQILRGRLYAAEYGVQAGRGQNPQVKVRNDLDGYRIEIDNVQERHNVERRRFEQDDRDLPGLADERLQLFVASLNPEPFLRHPDEADDVFMERAFHHVLDNLGARGLLRQAIDGERLESGQQEVLEQLVRFLRGEAERLHEEVVYRLRRGEGESKALQVLRVAGRGSLRLGGAFAIGIVAALAAVVVGLARGWFFSSDSNPIPTTTTTPTITTTTTKP